MQLPRGHGDSCALRNSKPRAAAARSAAAGARRRIKSCEAAYLGVEVGGGRWGVGWGVGWGVVRGRVNTGSSPV